MLRFGGAGMTRRSVARTIAVGLFLALSIPGSDWLWKHRYFAFKNNFRVVQPGRIYAGAYQNRIPLEQIIDQYHIKTVLSLRESGDTYEEKELQVLARKGVQFRDVAIPFKVSDEDRIAQIER